MSPVSVREGSQSSWGALQRSTRSLMKPTSAGLAGFHFKSGICPAANLNWGNGTSHIAWLPVSYKDSLSRK